AERAQDSTRWHPASRERPDASAAAVRAGADERADAVGDGRDAPGERAGAPGRGRDDPAAGGTTGVCPRAGRADAAASCRAAPGGDAAPGPGEGASGGPKRAGK